MLGIGIYHRYWAFAIEKVDDFRNPIQLLDPVSQDTILFEVAYTTLICIRKVESIRSEERFDFYMATIQNITSWVKAKHAIVGCGIHPNWDKMRIVGSLSRYQMLMDYLNLGEM